MFRPQEMSKVELVVPERDVVPVTEALAASGVFHLAETGYACAENTACPTGEWHEWAATFTTLERRILAIMEVLSVDEGPPPSKTPHLVGPTVAQMDVERLEQEAQPPILDNTYSDAFSLFYLAGFEPVGLKSDLSCFALDVCDLYLVDSRS